MLQSWNFICSYKIWGSTNSNIVVLCLAYAAEIFNTASQDSLTIETLQLFTNMCLISTLSQNFVKNTYVHTATYWLPKEGPLGSKCNSCSHNLYHTIFSLGTDCSMSKVPQKFFCFGYRTITLIKPDIRVGEAVISWNLHFVHIHLSHKAFVKTEYSVGKQPSTVNADNSSTGLPDFYVTSLQVSSY